MTSQNDEPPCVDNVLALVRVACRIQWPIRGELAAVLARMIHAAGIDRPGQVGNAYYRCPKCSLVVDCYDRNCLNPGKGAFPWCRDCNRLFTIDDLRLSEGWTERLLGGDAALDHWAANRHARIREILKAQDKPYQTAISAAHAVMAEVERLRRDLDTARAALRELARTEQRGNPFTSWVRLPYGWPAHELASKALAQLERKDHENRCMTETSHREGESHE